MQMDHILCRTFLVGWLANTLSEPVGTADWLAGGDLDGAHYARTSD